MVEISPISSQKSSPDLKRGNSTGSNISGESGFSANITQKPKEIRETPTTVTISLTSQQTQIQSVSCNADKPPIPPRGVFPPVPQRQTSTENVKRESFGKNIWKIYIQSRTELRGQI